MASRTPTASGNAGPSAAHPGRDVADIKVKNYPLLIFGMMLASIMQVLDMTIANVALPHMQSAMGTTTETTTWILTSYIIASAVTVPLTGWLRDKVGMRKLFIYAIVGFVLTSMLCGMARTIEQMVVFRAMQGVTGAFFLPLSQSLMLDTTRPSKHVQIMSLWGSVVMIGPILGPVLGGWLTEYWSWRWVFYVNVPIGAVALAILFAQLPKTKTASRKFDAFGYLVIAGALAALQLLLDRGNQIDWFESIEAWIYLFIILSGAWAAIVHTVMARNPLFHRHLFLDANLVVALFFMVILGTVLYSTLALLPPLLQGLYGYDTVQSGLLLAPRGIGFLVAARFLTLFERWDVDIRATVASGLLLVALSGAMMAQWSLTIDQWDIFWPGFIQGIGMAMIFVPLNLTAFATISTSLRTDAASLLQVFRTVGSSIGISIMASLFSRSVQVSHSDLAGQLQSSAGGMLDVTTIDRFQRAGDGALRFIDAEVNRQAAMIAYINDFQLMFWLTLASVPLVLLLRPKSRSDRNASEDSLEPLH